MNGFSFADKAYIIFNSLLYTKFFIQEAVLAQRNDYSIFDSFQANHSYYILYQIEELAKYRQVISETYSHFLNTTESFSDEYRAYTENTTVAIRTLSNGAPSVIFNTFSEMISRIPTTIFYVSSVNDNQYQINMDNKNAYELMMNLMNDYLLIWRESTLMLVRSIKSNTNSDNRLLVIFAGSFFISIISIVGIQQLFNKFFDDREKPIDLLMTIKNQKFEQLKFTSQNFMNKLLNTFFGNEHNDEDEQIDHATKFSSDSSDDIVMAKFRQKTKYKKSFRHSHEYYLFKINIYVFFLIFQGYMTFKFFYMENGVTILKNVIDVFNNTQYAQSDLIISCNVVK